MQRGVYRFSVEADDAGQRLDQYLPAATPAASRSLLRRIIDFGGVHVNGRRTRTCSLPVRAGDRIEVHCDGLPLEPFVLTEERIVYRDQFVLVLDKPAGIDCQPTPARFKGTLYAALLELLADPRHPRRPPEIGMVQRLDRDTSGLLVFSTHARAHQGLTRQFAERSVGKTYLAVVAGALAEEAGEYRSALAKNRATNLVRSVEKGGQEAVTRYRTLARTASASLVEIELLTGRSHQIRAHFSEAGHPLVGDTRYGGPPAVEQQPVARQMLHAARLAFAHPVTDAPLSFAAPLPPDMAAVVRQLFKELP